MAWRWSCDGADGAAVPLPEGLTAEETFPSQADAETWVGETWRELREAGVVAVTLYDDDRRVYGPMSLDPS